MTGIKGRLGYEKESGELFLTLNGLRIGKRGNPGTPQAGTWISLEPGYTVIDNADLTALVVHFNGVRVQ